MRERSRHRSAVPLSVLIALVCTACASQPAKPLCSSKIPVAPGAYTRYLGSSLKLDYGVAVSGDLVFPHVEEPSNAALIHRVSSMLRSADERASAACLAATAYTSQLSPDQVKAAHAAWGEKSLSFDAAFIAAVDAKSAKELADSVINLNLEDAPGFGRMYGPSRR